MEQTQSTQQYMHLNVSLKAVFYEAANGDMT